MPQFVGEHEAKSKNQDTTINPKKTTTRKGHHTFDSFIVNNTESQLTLGELLKVRPHLWNELAKMLQKMGVKGISDEHVRFLKEDSKTPTNV